MSAGLHTLPLLVIHRHRLRRGDSTDAESPAKGFFVVHGGQRNRYPHLNGPFVFNSTDEFGRNHIT